jgi:hypothetical protein
MTVTGARSFGGCLISACAGANDPAQKKLQESLRYSWPNQRWDHFGRAVDSIQTERLVWIAGEQMYLNVSSTTRGEAPDMPVQRGRNWPICSMQSGISIYARQDARSSLTVS